MTGERRLAIVLRRHSGYFVCAESLPDVARAAGARTGADVETPRVSLAFDDQMQTALLQTFTRTETADVVRQLGWQTCSAYANGAISSEAYTMLLGRIIDGANDVMRRRASAGATIAAGGTVQVNLGQPQTGRASASSDAAR